MQLTQDLILSTAQQSLHDLKQDTSIELSYAEMAVLQRLASTSGQLITKEQLIDAGWPDRVVAQSSLQQCISQLRKKLAEYPEIELKTIPRHGYTLNLPKVSTKRSGLALSWSLLLSGFIVILIGVFVLNSLLSDRQGTYKQTMFVKKLNDSTGKFDVFYNHLPTSPTSEEFEKRLYDQIAFEPHWQSPFKSFQGFSVVTDEIDSFSICPNYSNGQCPGGQLINISGKFERGDQISLSDFLSTKLIMEEHKTNNRLELDELKGHSGKLIEQIYRGDQYFSVEDELLVRSDFRISLVNLDSKSGLFYFATCITDEEHYSTPSKYRINGSFYQESLMWDGNKVDKFEVTVSESELTSPKALAGTAQPIYLNLRRQHLTRESLVFYRLYQDDNTAVWIIPMGGDNVVWTNQQELRL